MSQLMNSLPKGPEALPTEADLAPVVEEVKKHVKGMADQTEDEAMMHIEK